MVREISAGGVVVRKQDDLWMIAVIEPQREAETAADPEKPTPPTKSRRSKSSKTIWALPKGLVDPGEKARARRAARGLRRDRADGYADRQAHRH